MRDKKDEKGGELKHETKNNDGRSLKQGREIDTRDSEQKL